MLEQRLNHLNGEKVELKETHQNQKEGMAKLQEQTKQLKRENKALLKQIDDMAKILYGGSGRSPSLKRNTSSPSTRDLKKN